MHSSCLYGKATESLSGPIIWEFLATSVSVPEDFPTVSVCFYITFYFGSTLAFDILPKVEWKVRWFPCIFPLFCQYSIAVVSSCYCSFLWPVLLLCYIFLVILSLFSDCGCIPFSVCYDFFSLLSLVLEILFRCLGRLSAPTVFLLLPNFFLQKEPWNRARETPALILLLLLAWDIGQSCFFSGLLTWCGLHSLLGVLQH